MNTIKFAYQSWWNGGRQVSALYKGAEVDSFIKSHNESGTFATLHVGGLECLDKYIETVNEIFPHHTEVTRANFI